MKSPSKITKLLEKTGVTWTLSIFIILLAGLPFVIYGSLSHHAEDESLRLARSFSSAISTVRSYYAKNVAARVLESHGQVVLTEKYLSQKGGIPIPATLSIELGEILREKSEATKSGSFSFAFVSDMPFLHRDRRPLDDFQQDALRSFRKENQNTEFWTIEKQSNGDSNLRLAIPVRMESACVSCHNSHPDSPLKTWKTGDVRGIQDVSIGMSILDQGQSSLTLGIYLIAFLLSGGLLFLQATKSNARLRGMYVDKVQSELSLNNKTSELKQKISELALKTDVIDKAPFGIAIADFDNNELTIDYINKSFSEITGYQQDELKGRNFRILSGDKTDPQQIELLNRALTEKRNIELDTEIHRRMGAPIWVHALFFPTYDQSNSFQHFIICISDITNLKNSEEEKLKLAGELQESMKLESLGLTIAGIAHDLNTPIGISITASSHLKTCLQDLKTETNRGNISALKEYFDDLEIASNLIDSNLIKAAELVSSFKQTSADATRTEWQQINLNAYLTTLTMSLSPITKRGKCEVKLTCSEGIMLYTEPGSLSQVITNIIINATVHAFKHRESNRQISIVAEEQTNNLVITIADNGSGMSEEVKSKIFMPFFTTNRTAGGSGLGLFSAKRTIESILGGHLTFESSPQDGTIFRLVLPNKLN